MIFRPGNDYERSSSSWDLLSNFQIPTFSFRNLFANLLGDKKDRLYFAVILIREFVYMFFNTAYSYSLHVRFR